MLRIPIRVRLTLSFALVISLVLVAIGGALYLRFQADLDQQINQNLRSRAADVSALVRQADSGLAQAGQSPLARRAESFAQIIDQHGRILDATTQVQGRSLLTDPQLRAARARTVIVAGTVGGESARLLATPARAQDQRLVVVVGATLGDRADALQRLGTLLLLGGPIAVLLASLAGYGLAAAALRPVDSMRRRASQISASEPGRRLPVPPADDEIRRLGMTLNDMLARLERAFEHERRFVADASHELRTPLAILKAELELAQREGRSEGDMRGALRSASEETDRLIRLAEDLLVIARADQGRLPVRAEQVDLRELVERSAERWQPRSRSTGRSLSVTVPDEPVFVQADPARVEQALGNLLDNAFRHGSGAVVASVQRRGASLALTVHDQGAGLPEGFDDLAFDRFSRGDGSRGDGGTGLGLAIVAAIAAAHGGAVGARRTEGGAEVWFSVPAEGQPPGPSG